MNIARWIDKHAAFAPDGAALRFADATISYRAMAREVREAAGKLATLEVKPGDVVAYLGFNSPTLVTLLFACARIGATLLPMNWRLAAPEHARILSDSRPRVVMVEPSFADMARTLAALPGPAWVMLGEAQHGIEAWNALSGTAPTMLDTADDTPVLLCYTSGSTGVPKGVVHSHGSLFWNAINSAHMHDLTSADRVLTTLPMFHVGGMNILTTPALHAGASVTLHAKFDPGETLAAIERERITLTVLVPAQLTALTEHPRWAEADLSSLRFITTGSTIIPESFVRKFHDRGLRIVQVYGSTETCPIAAYLRADVAERKAGSAGLPALHCDLKIVDGEGRTLPPGVNGEIAVRGPNFMRGYLNLPEATAAAQRDGWYHSGDVGHLDEDGFLYVVARKNDMIISGGENVYPAEIENILMECPDIVEASVVSRPDERWGEAIVAVIVLKAGVRLTKTEVLAMLEGRIARYKHPRDVLFSEALPRSALGKVMKDDLRAAVSGPNLAMVQG